MEQKIAIPGTAVEIDGQGCLLTGNSGSGKSTLALALVYQGHRLIGDDLVMIERQDNLLSIKPECHLNQFLALPALGFMNLTQLTGKASATQSAPLSFIVNLNTAPKEQHESDQFIELLDTALPYIELLSHSPCNERLIEASAAHFKLKAQGYDSNQDFMEKHRLLIQGKQADDAILGELEGR